jgi:predicted metal-dependent phosphoesterase TrpH
VGDDVSMDGLPGENGSPEVTRISTDSQLVPGIERIDYHVHTCWSPDCATPLEALIDRAHEARLTSLCVTDHDTIDGALALKRISPPGLDIVVGCEFTTEDGSQIIGLDLSVMISERNVLELMQRIREQGGLVLLPHPFRRGSGIFRSEIRRPDTFVGDVLSATDLVECFNGRDTYDNNRRSYLFAVRRALPAVAGSDAHTASEVGSVFVEYQRDDGRRHGSSARRIYFPDQPRRSEHALKRRAMEFYHRHEARLPAIVGVAYHVSRRRLRLDRPPRGDVSPRMQYELPAAGVGVDADER